MRMSTLRMATTFAAALVIIAATSYQRLPVRQAPLRGFLADLWSEAARLEPRDGITTSTPAAETQTEDSPTEPATSHSTTDDPA